MNGFDLSSQQFIDTESLCSSNSDSEITNTDDTDKDSNNLRATIYNRSNLIKKHLLNRQREQNNKSQLQNQNKHNELQDKQGNKDLQLKQKNMRDSQGNLISQQKQNKDEKVSLADVGRVYENTNYTKWLNNIHLQEVILDMFYSQQIGNKEQKYPQISILKIQQIYMDPSSKKKNSQLIKDLALDSMLYNRAVRSQSSVSEYYKIKLNKMNEQLGDIKEKILRDQIQNYNKQLTLKGSVNGLKQMSQQSNKKNSSDYQDEILSKCNRADSYFNYKRNHNFLPKRAATSLSITKMVDQNQSQINKSTDKKGNKEGDKVTSKSSVNSKLNSLSKSYFLARDEINELSDLQTTKLLKQPSIEAHSPFLELNQVQSSQEKSSKELIKSSIDDPFQKSLIFSQLSNKKKLSTVSQNKSEIRSVSQQDRVMLDADFSLTPIRENKSQIRKSIKLPQVKNEKSLLDKNTLKIPNKEGNSIQQQSIQLQKEFTLTPHSLSPNILPYSPSQKSFQVSEKKGNRLAQQIERKINKLKKIQRMSTFHVNDNQNLYGSSQTSFIDLNLEKQNSNFSSVFQSPVLNKGISLSSKQNKQKYLRKQSNDKHNSHEISLGQSLIKEEDESEVDQVLTRKHYSRKGSINLLQQQNSVEKIKLNKLSKQQSPILIQEDPKNQKDQQPSQNSQQSESAGNEIQLFRKSPVQKHKTAIFTDQSPVSCRSNALNVSDLLKKSVQNKQRSTQNTFNSPIMQQQTAQILIEETQKIKEQLPDIVNQLIKGIEEEYGKKQSADILYLFYTQLQQIIQIEINDIEQNLRFKYDKQLSERKKYLKQKLLMMKGMQNLILSCCSVDEEIKNGNRQLYQMKRKQIGQIKNINFYYNILQQHDFPDEEIGKVILQMKQMEQVRDDANADQFVKDYRYNIMNNQMDSNIIIMQTERQDRNKRVKEFNQQRRNSKMQKLQ